MAQSLQNRIERAKQAAKTQSRFSSECICFPEKEQPFFNWPCEQQVAAQVKCLLHGERFRPLTFFVYVAKWHREKQQRLLQTHDSEQYRKAWYASFPLELWPADEVLINNSLGLRPKDGTMLPVW